MAISRRNILIASLGGMFFLALGASAAPKQYDIAVTEACTLVEALEEDGNVMLDKYPLDGVYCPYVRAVEDFEFPIDGDRGFEIAINGKIVEESFDRVQVERGDLITIRVISCA